MNEESVTDAVVRKFLLGDVDDDERRRIESLFISDAGTRTKILSAEDDLVEDYLEGGLTASDRDKFLAQYESTPRQRRKLRIARSIREYAVAEATLTQTQTSANPIWRNLLAGLRLRNRRVFIPVAATLTVAFIVAVVWLVDMNRRRAHDHNRRAAIEREIADLNEPSRLRELPPQMFSIVLPPVSVRSVGPQTELTPRTDTRVVELQLLWTQKERYPGYRAVLSRIGNADQLTIPNLHAEDNLGGSTIRLRLPAHLLSSGLYQVRLSGIASDGVPSQAEEYSFMFGG